MPRSHALLTLLLPAACAVPTPKPEAMSEAFFSALESKDLEAAAALFSEDATILESGKLEGSWSDYERHHLRPEIDAMRWFRIEPVTSRARVSEDGSMALIWCTIRYRVVFDDGAVIEREGTITFVVIETEAGPRIQHLHWSTRKPEARSREPRSRRLRL